MSEAEQNRVGSSPLTRGKRRNPGPRRNTTRLIPAHAGKTSGLFRCVVQRRAHPRSRGENEAYNLLEALNKGSSPLTRGKLTNPKM